MQFPDSFWKNRKIFLSINHFFFDFFILFVLFENDDRIKKLIVKMESKQAVLSFKQVSLLKIIL